MIRTLLLIAAGAVSFGQNLQDLLKQGEKVFGETCATGYCHGPKGTTGGAPRLVGRGFDPAFINNTVRRGVPGTAMPGFAESLPRPDVIAVVSYVATLNGFTNPNIGDSGDPPPAPEITLSPVAARGRDLFSDTMRGFARCSTCHEVNRIGISVVTPITQVPPSASALRLLATLHVSTATAGDEIMPVLVLSNTTRNVLLYDLTASNPVLRTLEPLSVKIAEGSSWRHASVIGSYRDSELDAILTYLREVVNP
jgi:mono/diheme cytochrome c family protein